MWMWQETSLQTFVKFGVNLTLLAPWLPWQRSPFWIFFNPQKLPQTMVDIPTKFHEVWWKESKRFFKSPLFCFHGNWGKVCLTHSDFLSYLIPLDVDVVPIKFHQFLFVPTMFHEVWWKKLKKIKIPPFLFPWQLRQSLSYRFRFVWLISFH